MATYRTAQASIEFLAILAMSLVVLTIVMVLAQQQMTTVQKQKDSADVQNSILDLSAAAKEVYAQGEGSRKQVFIRLPGSYEPNRSFIANRSIQIRAAGTDYVAVENFNVRGYLPTTSGGQWVWVTSEGNQVRIGPAMMALNKNRIYLVMDKNTTASASFSVTNAWVKAITVTTVTTWGTADVAMSGVPSGFSLNVNGTDVISLQFTAAPISGGVYSGEIELDASDGQGATESVGVPVTVYVIGYPTSQKDLMGPIITSITQSPTPAVVYKPVAIMLSATDEQTGNNAIKKCEIDADYANNWKVMLPMDGAYDHPVESAIYNYTSGFSWGLHGMRTRCTDAMNNTGPIAYYYLNVTQDDTFGPIITLMNHTAYPTTLSDIFIGGIGTDVYTGGSNIAFCQVKLDSGAWHNTTADDGAFDSPIENFTYEAGPMPAGYHRVYYMCTDSVGNVGGIFNDSFGVVDVDLMLVIDKSPSMDWNVTNVTDSTIVSTTNTGFTRLKNITVPAKNGDLANLTTEIRTNTTGCTALYEARINGVVVASGNRTSTSYGRLDASINISRFAPPFDIALYMKRNYTSSCTAYNQMFSIQQMPKKLAVAQIAAKTFVDVVDAANQAGLASFGGTASLDKQLAHMGTSNKTALKAAIDSLAYVGSTCMECGLEAAANEMVSARGRPTATRVIVLLTDGVTNMNAAGQSVSDPSSSDNAGAVYCRNRNVTVYTIGFGNDVDDQELTNIALLTNGEYYFAPDSETLLEIFANIGK